MILQRQMADVMLLSQLAAASPVSATPSRAVFAPSTSASATHRRFSLDNYVGSPHTSPDAWDSFGMPEIFPQKIATNDLDSAMTASLVRGAPPSWPSQQTIPNLLSSSTQVFTASDEEDLFRARSMSLGSAASRSLESGSGSSSPSGPTSPTNVAGLSNSGPWANVVRFATSVFDDSRQWFDSRSASTSWSVPDSPTSMVGSGIADVASSSSSFYSSPCRQSTRPNRIIAFDKQPPYQDGRRHMNHAQMQPNCVEDSGCGAQQRVPQIWPTC